MTANINETGDIKISDDAVAMIAAIAAKKVEGVIGLDSGPVGGIAEALGMQNMTKGIKVNMGKDSVSLDVNLVVLFGQEISDVAVEVQEKVKEAIENMTGLIVDKINVNINSVRSPKEKSL
jgi:uncharacterized alkaline shock family protein YloU